MTIADEMRLSLAVDMLKNLSQIAVLETLIGFHEQGEPVPEKYEDAKDAIKHRECQLVADSGIIIDDLVTIGYDHDMMVRVMLMRKESQGTP